MAKHRVPRQLVALSASAVAVIFATGYVHTQAADESISIGSTPPTVIVAATPSARAFTRVPLTPTSRSTAEPSVEPSQIPAALAEPASIAVGPGVAATAVPTPRPASPTALPTPRPTAIVTQGANYSDGAFTGTGRSARGDVTAQVVVRNGAISSVTITRATTLYPTGYIQPLLAEVVQRQSAKIDIVSRATYSSVAFRLAVQQALSQAQG